MNSAQGPLAHARITLRRLDAGLRHQLLNGAKTHPILVQVGGKRVTHGVIKNPLRQDL